MINFCTVKETALRWRVSAKEVYRLLAAGRVGGAFKKADVWLIPADAERPQDPRKGRKTVAYYPYILLTAENPSETYYASDAELLCQLRAEMALLQGDTKPAVERYTAANRMDRTYFNAAITAMSAAVIRGDLSLFQTIMKDLAAIKDGTANAAERNLAEIVLSTMAVSMKASFMAGEWLHSGDYSAVGRENIPWAMYVKAKLYSNHGDHARQYTAAETVLPFLEKGNVICGIYLHLMCAAAAFKLKKGEDNKKHLLSAIRLAKPYGI